MKYIVVLFLLNSMASFSQMWKEPFDTLPYIDHFERLKGNKIGIKSYSVTEYLDKDSILSYNFYGFDRNGYLTEQFYAMFPHQHTDTNKYHYKNGILQGSGFKREHIYNENKRLIEIRNSKNDSTWSTNYTYNDNNLIEIRYSQQNWTTFQYDLNGRLQRKEIFQNGKLKEYLSYYYPENNVTAYCDCNLIKVYNETIAACDSTIGTFNKFGKLSRLEMHFYKDDTPHYVSFKYDRKGRIMKMSYEEATGNASTVYFRSRKGLLARVEHRDENGRVYNYSEFVYEY
ncbi:MAG: hypothetical protein QNK23_06100 [Crocinitomicaceae bacterium]|nr:hypothetical protein [Crocinitomicaceae bacterium]